MPRILFDARLVLDRPTGIGQYVAALLPELLRARPDWEFHVLRRPDPWPGYGLSDLPATQHVSRMRHMALQQHIVVPGIARSVGADLLHYPHFDAPVAPGPPLVATIYDAKYLAHPEFFPRFSAAKRFYMRRMYARTLQRARVVTLSSFTADDLLRIFPRTRRRPDVVPAAAEPRFAPADDGAVARFRAAHGITRPYLLAVGEFRPHKNHLRLVRAWTRSRAIDSHDLVLVGHPRPEGDDPAAEAAALGHGDRLHALSGISHGELAAAYTGADAFLMVSLYEGFGLPILEAMMCGVPVIASSTTATGETAADAAITVDPLDEAAIAGAIDQVLSDEAERRRLRKAGRIRAAAFSWARAAEGVIRVHEDVLAGGRA
jgi:glycosyltransferase involved in cell wall biosynthesis